MAILYIMLWAEVQPTLYQFETTNTDKERFCLFYAVYFKSKTALNTQL